MSKLSITIRSEPHGYMLASDGRFYGATLSIRGCHTLVYRSKLAALKRLYNQNPHKKISARLYPNACLHVTQTDANGTQVKYILDRFGKQIQ